MPWSGAHQAPLSMGFPRQECWSGLPFPSPGNLPDPGVELTSPALTARFFTTVPPGNPSSILYYLLFDFKFKRIEWKKLMDCSIFSLSPFYYSNRNLDVKLLSIYQFRKKFLNVNYICHGKNRVGRYLLSFWNVNSFLFQVYFKHPIKDYLLIKWSRTHFEVKYSSDLFMWSVIHGNPLQYSGLENSMDRGVWQATVHRVTKSWTRLSD